jgi:RNA polymerase sigma-70 factor, ECF subfamily
VGQGVERLSVRFEELLRRYEKEIYRFTYRMTGNREDAADVLQDTFFRAFRAYPRLPEKANHRAWLYRIASRSALNLARSQKMRRTLPLEKARHLVEKNGDLEHLVETRRLAGCLGDIVRALPARQRIALLQRKYQGLSYREIAATLDCSEQGARAHVYQAMAKIRRGLAASKK